MADPSFSPNTHGRTSLPNPGKSTRTSLSILKPLKARCPLQDLDQLLNTEEDTTTSTFTAMRRRRVSFAGVNQVKEFHTAAESLTVHHTPAYDEPFTTTMSSDSSGHHHLTDSKISDNTCLEQTSRLSSGPIVTSALDAVLDLTVKSTNVSFKPEELDPEAKENLTDNFRPLSQNTCYEADMECTTPHPVVYYESKNFSFNNKSLEFTSVASELPHVQHSKSMMEFTEVIRGPVFSNENLSRHYESMEFTQHVNGQLAVKDSEFFDENEYTFSQPMPKADIFNLLSSGTSLSAAEAVGQVNSIFGHQNNVADLNESADMSFGVTGVISQPLIECLKSIDDSEGVKDDTQSNCSSEPPNCNPRTECSNAEESEMELTEAIPFSNQENGAQSVTDSLDVIKKTIFDNFKTKPTDDILSFLRKKVSGPSKVNHSSDHEASDTVHEQQANRSNHANSQGNLSVSKSQTMEITTALANNIRGDSAIDEFVSKASLEFESAVNHDSEVSVLKNSSMERTKGVSNDVRSTNSKTSFSNISCIPATDGDNSHINDRKSFNKLVSDTVDFDASNVITSTQECKTSAVINSEEEITFLKKDRKSSINKNLTECSERKSGRVFDSMDYAANFATSNQERNPSDIIHTKYLVNEEALAITAADFNETEIVTSTQKSRLSQNIPVTSNGRKSLSVESFLGLPKTPVSMNFGMKENFALDEVQDLMSNGKGASSQPESNDVELHHSNSSASSQDPAIVQQPEFVNLSKEEKNSIINNDSFIGSQPMEFTNVHAFGRVNLELGSHNTDGQEMDFTHIRTSSEKTTFESNSQSLPGSQEIKFVGVQPFERDDIEGNPQIFVTDYTMNSTNTHTGEREMSHSRSQNTSSSRTMESNNALITDNACSADISAMEFTDVHVYQCGTNTEPCLENFSTQQEKLSQSIPQEISENPNSSCAFNKSLEANVPSLEDQSDRAVNVRSMYDNEDHEGRHKENLLNQPPETMSTNNFEPSMTTGEEDGDFLDASVRATNEKKRQKSRRSELFVPMQKSFLHNEMSLIEESETVGSSESFACDTISSGKFSQSFQHTERTMRSEALPTPKPASVFNAVFPKSNPDLQSSKFDCGYKINESQMFTKSMMEQTSEDEFDISQSVKSKFESEAYDPLNSLFVSKSYESFSHKVISNHLIASVGTAKDEGVLSPFDITEKKVSQSAELQTQNTNEDTQTFSRLMKSVVEDSAKRTDLFKPGNCSMVPNVFNESQFTLPVENIPRSIFLSDEIECPPLSELSEVRIASNNLENCFESHEVTHSNKHTVLENEQSQMTDSGSGEAIISDVLDKQSPLSNTPEVAGEESSSDNNELVASMENQYKQQNLSANNEEFLSNDIENHPFEADVSTHKICDESYPVAEFTINEDLLKNITVSRSKPRKDIRKSRCLVDLDNSITRQYEKDVKKVKISDESCNITGIGKLPDFSINSVVSPPLGKTMPVQQEAMDISANKIQVDETILNHQIDRDLEIDVPAVISKNIPESIASQRSPLPILGIKPETEQLIKTPKSILKKKQTENIPTNTSAPNSDAKKVYLQECSGPKKRGFVKNAARLYESFVATESSPKVDLNHCKQELDGKYVKGQKPLLKRFLDTTASNANAIAQSDVEPVNDDFTAKVVTCESPKYVSFSPEEGFEKSDYTPMASSNTSMICNNRSFVSPIFKTPKSKSKSERKVEESPMTPKSPARKRLRLPFESTPIKNTIGKQAGVVDINDLEDDYPQSDIVDANIHSPESLSESDIPENYCSDFVERFEAETRPTRMYWKVIEATDSLWSFEFLDGQLRLTIHFKPAAANCLAPVKEIAFDSVMPDAEPKQVIGQNIILERYPLARLEGLCRNASNVFDVLHMIANDVIFAKKVMFSLDGMITAKFSYDSVTFDFIIMRPNHLAEITVDLSSWQSVSSSSVSVKNLIGTIREQKIRSLFEECEKDEDCIRQFWLKCQQYMSSQWFTAPKIW
nr:PREDICTED: uncharacterized protein LOC109038093 [Bemisia tabaci]